MATATLWADMSDDEILFSDEESYSTMPELPSPGYSVKSDSLEGLPLPVHLKLVNFPFDATENGIHQFLGRTDSLELLYSRGGKNKFRGIAVFRATDYEVAYQILELNGKIFEGREIAVEVAPSWVARPRVKAKLLRPKNEQWRCSNCPTFRGSRKNN